MRQQGRWDAWADQEMCLLQRQDPHHQEGGREESHEEGERQEWSERQEVACQGGGHAEEDPQGGSQEAHEEEHRYAGRHGVNVPAFIVGADECGYGSWAGPLVAAAVAYPATGTAPSAVTVRNRRIEVCDSKLLKPDVIHLLAHVIKCECFCFECYAYSAQDVDLWGVDVAKLRLLRLVIARILERLHHVNGVDGGVHIIVDGETNLQPCDFVYDAIPQADATVWQVSAASVIAKQRQLQEMAALHQRCPEYGFDRHAGYGTKQHREALKKHGISSYHRRSFAPIRRLLPTPEGLEE